MNDEVKAAAERLRRDEYYSDIQEDAKGEPTGNVIVRGGMWDDATDLVDWCLPLLDPTPIPDDLTTIGFENYGTKDWPLYRTQWSSHRGGPLCKIFVDSMMGCDGWEVGYESNKAMITPPNTMGELRMLCLGLSIPLTESEARDE